MIIIKRLSESTPPSLIEESISSWIAVNYEMLFRIFHFILKRSIHLLYRAKEKIHCEIELIIY